MSCVNYKIGNYKIYQTSRYIPAKKYDIYRNKRWKTRYSQVVPKKLSRYWKFKKLSGIKLHVDKNIKPIAEPTRTIPYHLQSQVREAIDEMIKKEVIEVHFINEPALWTSNIVATWKPDGNLGITIDVTNVNGEINRPIYLFLDMKTLKPKWQTQKRFQS